MHLKIELLCTDSPQNNIVNPRIVRVFYEAKVFACVDSFLVYACRRAFSLGLLSLCRLLPQHGIGHTASVYKISKIYSDVLFQSYVAKLLTVFSQQSARYMNKTDFRSQVCRLAAFVT